MGLIPWHNLQLSADKPHLSSSLAYIEQAKPKTKMQLTSKNIGLLGGPLAFVLVLLFIHHSFNNTNYSH